MWSVATDKCTDLTTGEAREMFRYDPDDGRLIWAVAKKKRRVGHEAGWMQDDGYKYVCVNGRSYLAHRIIYLIMTGEWPRVQVDHKDTNRANNKWNNLRAATNGQNSCNARVRDGIVSGYKGVSFRRGKYRARIHGDGREVHLGDFPTLEEARAARASAARVFHREYARN